MAVCPADHAVPVIDTWSSLPHRSGNLHKSGFFLTRDQSLVDIRQEPNGRDSSRAMRGRPGKSHPIRTSAVHAVGRALSILPGEIR